jgi:site-specific DNA recombinase
VKRAAIYARFSTDLQDDRSIEDQIAICREYARRHDLLVVETYDDRAASGASVFNRDGVQRMLAAARAGVFDVVIAESMSRVGRDQEDRAAIRKRLRFAGVTTMTPADGVVTDLTDGIRAVIDSQFLDDLKHATRRGMAGVIRDKRHAGGRAYGYLPVKGEPGRLLIVEREARTVRRIFEEFVGGSTSREIARRLNAEGVPPPRGEVWGASTVTGNATRGTGIVRNELYAGRLIWNRLRMVRDPDTGRRVSRPNPRQDWHVVEVPELAIVPPLLFEAAQRRVKARSDIPSTYLRKPKRPLSGLLRCAACGGGMSTYGKRKGEPKRVRCTRDAETGTCPDPRTFYIDRIEEAVVAALRAELRHPDVITEFVRTYHKERRRLASQQDAKRTHAERRLAEVRREIERIVDGVTRGELASAVFGPRASALDEERKSLEASMAEEHDTVVTLHPAALARYEEIVGRLQQSMAQGTAAGNAEYPEVMRDLIQSVTVRAGDEPGRVKVTIEGRLNALLGEEAFPNRRKGRAGGGMDGSGGRI